MFRLLYLLVAPIDFIINHCNSHYEDLLWGIIKRKEIKKKSVQYIEITYPHHSNNRGDKERGWYYDGWLLNDKGILICVNINRKFIKLLKTK